MRSCVGTTQVIVKNVHFPRASGSLHCQARRSASLAKMQLKPRDCYLKCVPKHLLSEVEGVIFTSWENQVVPVPLPLRSLCGQYEAAGAQTNWCQPRCLLKKNGFLGGYFPLNMKATFFNVEFSDFSVLSFGLIVFDQSSWRLSLLFYLFFAFHVLVPMKMQSVWFLCCLTFLVSLLVVLLL